MTKIKNKISDILFWHEDVIKFALIILIFVSVVFSIIFVDVFSDTKMLSTKYKNCTFELVDVEYSECYPHYIYKVLETNDLIDLASPIEKYNF